MLWRDCSVLDEGYRPFVTLSVSEKADGLFAHVPDRIHLGLTARHRESAATLPRPGPGECLSNSSERIFHVRFVISDELYEVHPLSSLALIFWEILLDGFPN